MLAGLAVTGVPAVQGFWVRYFDGAPLWVHLIGDGGPAPHVDADDIVTITATVRAVAEQSDSGVPAQQADRLNATGMYLDVAAANVAINPPGAPPNT